MNNKRATARLLAVAFISITMNLLIHIIAIASLLVFLAFAIDKMLAKMNAWRIPEAVLLWLALLGGAAGALAAMNMFHHKTSKRWFTVGVPLMQIAHVALLLLMLYM